MKTDLNAIKIYRPQDAGAKKIALNLSGFLI